MWHVVRRDDPQSQRLGLVQLERAERTASPSGLRRETKRKASGTMQSKSRRWSPTQLEYQVGRREASGGMRRLATGETLSLACSIAGRQLARRTGQSSSCHIESSSYVACAKNAGASFFCVGVSIECGPIDASNECWSGIWPRPRGEIPARNDVTEVEATHFDKASAAKSGRLSWPRRVASRLPLS